jgi:hypothetical protein
MPGLLNIFSGTQQQKNTMLSSNATARQNGFPSTPFCRVRSSAGISEVAAAGLFEIRFHDVLLRHALGIEERPV